MRLHDVIIIARQAINKKEDDKKDLMGIVAVLATSKAVSCVKTEGGRKGFSFGFPFRVISLSGYRPPVAVNYGSTNRRKDEVHKCRS